MSAVWCECGRHLIDVRHGPTCPVCADRARKAAEAKVAALGWKIHGTGGLPI